jgi:DNA-binding response OmpR family regulator
VTYRSALVVDGARPARLRAVTLLRLAGFRTYEADRAGSALIWATRHTPGLVLTDAVLPDGDGLELISELRYHGSPAEFLVVAAHPTAALRDQAFRAGATACVAKPLEAADLVTFLRGPTTGRATPDHTGQRSAEWLLQQHALHVNSVRADRRAPGGPMRSGWVREAYAIPLPHRSSPVGGDHLRGAAVHDDRA